MSTSLSRDRARPRGQFRNLAAVVASFAISVTACASGDERSPQPSWNDRGIPAGTHGAVDVITPRTLSYRLSETIDGVTTDIDFDAEFDDGVVQIPLYPFFQIQQQGDFDIDARGFASRPDDGAVPAVLMLFHSMPDASLTVGQTWETKTPTDDDAEATDAAVMQSRRGYQVVNGWSTPQGLVVRVEIKGYSRWYPNSYMENEVPSGFEVPQGERPEHFGHVDVNVSSGTVVDALFFAELMSPAETPEELTGSPGAKQMLLCPGAGADFEANADTCP